MKLAPILIPHPWFRRPPSAGLPGRFYAPSFIMVALMLYLGCFCFIFAEDEVGAY